MNENIVNIKKSIRQIRSQIFELEHKESRKQQKHDWRIKNIEKITTQDKKRFQENREHYRQYRKEYYVRTGN